MLTSQATPTQALFRRNGEWTNLDPMSLILKAKTWRSMSLFLSNLRFTHTSPIGLTWLQSRMNMPALLSRWAPLKLLADWTVFRRGVINILLPAMSLPKTKSTGKYRLLSEISLSPSSGMQKEGLLLRIWLRRKRLTIGIYLHWGKRTQKVQRKWSRAKKTNIGERAWREKT